MRRNITNQVNHLRRSAWLASAALAFVALLVAVGCETESSLATNDDQPDEAAEARWHPDGLEARSPVARPVVDPLAVDLATPVIAPTEGRTTAGNIVVANLEGQIRANLGLYERTGHPGALTAASQLLLQRARIVGQRQDVDQARELLEPLVEGDGADVSADACQAYAAVLAYDHRFQEALDWIERAADLEEEAASGPNVTVASGSTSSSEAAEAELRYALGEVDGPIETFEELVRQAPNWSHLGALANTRIDQGQYDDAERLFWAAPSGYSDPHPLPLAWLDVQHGVMYLRRGDALTANAYFRAAYERFPEFYLASEHLAETEALLGRLDVARALYDEVIAQTDNPEFYHALAGVESELGNETRAAELDSAARERYEALLEAQPLAYAAHAAGFFLEIGEPRRALELARLDVAARRPVGSLLTWAEAALATGHREEACEAWAEAVATGLEPPEMGELSEAFATCP